MNGHAFLGVIERTCRVLQSGRRVFCDTAVDSEATPTLFVSGRLVEEEQVVPESLSLEFEGDIYEHTRHDPLTNRHTYTKVSKVPHPIRDTHEGQEVAAMENEGGVVAERYTAANWPDCL